MMKKIILLFIILLVFFVLYMKSEEKQEFKIDPGSIVIDVRTDQEYRQGHLKDAINIPYDEIDKKIAQYVDNKNENIVLYCRSGRRSGIALKILQRKGYINAVNAGAYSALKKIEAQEK